jgi:hypothetical protein
MKTQHPLLQFAFAVATAATISVGVAPLPAAAQSGGMEVTTPRGPDEGDGPHERLILRGATIIDGTGAPRWAIPWRSSTRIGGHRGPRARST